MTEQVQDYSGQVLIGLIKMAFRTLHHLKYIRLDDVCPYRIITCPRHDRKKGVLESFSNCGHQDSTDCTNEAQGSLVFADLQEVVNKDVFHFR
jgi:hypothetical protein